MKTNLVNLMIVAMPAGTLGLAMRRGDKALTGDDLVIVCGLLTIAFCAVMAVLNRAAVRISKLEQRGDTQNAFEERPRD